MQITEIHFESIDSTNSYAKQEYAKFDPEKLTIVSADVQSGGYGRYKRKWVSLKGNLLLTFCFKIKRDVTTLGLVASYSIATVLEELQPKIKWPNDVQLSGKKVSGALCETIFEKDGAWVFLGIGLNVNMEKTDLEKIDQPATSLKVESGKTWDLREVKHKLQTQIASDLERFKKEGFKPFHDAIEKLLAYRGEKISCFDGKKKWVGICHSLGPDGQLNLQLEDGTIHQLLTGDITNFRKTVEER